MFYDIVKPFLFALDAECSHDGVLALLKQRQKIKYGLHAPVWAKKEEVSCFGLSFPNRVGLAAGLDKNAECVEAFRSFGFGFIEVGTVTPRAQSGNPKPRLFRYPNELAMINRMGFNNRGVEYMIERLSGYGAGCPIGVNIGKNRDTALDAAIEDYLFCFQKVYEWADYITINLSSPNTPGLRDLQQKAYLQRLLATLMEARKSLQDKQTKHVPILVKISPDLSLEALYDVIDTLLSVHVEGVIATNTTITRPWVVHPKASEEGGLSGAPLRDLSTRMIHDIAKRAGEALPIVAVGGILSALDAKEKLAAGAKLVQLYTGFIYRGPSLVREIVESLS